MLGRRLEIDHRHDPAQDVDEEAGERQVRPGRIAPTWTSTMRPLPRRSAVMSGVPSASCAQVLPGRPASGSARTWRETVTSAGTCRPKNGLAWSKGRVASAFPRRTPRRARVRRAAARPARDRRRNRRGGHRQSAGERRRRRRIAPIRHGRPGATMPSARTITLGRSPSGENRIAVAGRGSRTSANGASALSR